MGRKRKVEEVEAPTKKDSEPEEDTSSLKKPLKQTKKKKKDRDVEEPPEASSSPPPLKKSKSPKKGPSPVKSPKKDLKGSKSPGTSSGGGTKSLPKVVPVLEASDAEEDSDEAEDIIAPQVDEEFDPENLPSVDTLHKLLERIETHLPKEDRVKYDSQVRKLDWEKIAFEGLSASHCQSTWMYIQARIRRFRVLSEMIPDAREWIQHPWTNFYKSRTFNRHPDMPKKPLSVYMFYYSQHMNKILKKNPDLSMPEVAKICSEQYAQLSEEKKLKYKEKCDEMKAEYNLKMNEFYSVHPDMAPVVKASKKGGAKQEAMKPVEPFVPPPTLQLQQQQPQTTYVLAAPNVLTLPTVPHPQVTAAVTAPPTMALPQMAASNNNNNIVYDPKYLPKPAKNAFSGAPERPVKPFELFFKKEMESVSGDPAFDRQAFAQKSRKEWKEMKNKKKAKWIKAAFENYRKYEAELREFTAANPTYVPPMSSHKNFLTIEDQKILDRSMGRPEKPSSSAYSLFSKEMLNNEDIKKYPSKERMSHISELWKTLPDEKKERYQTEVNEAMGIYRQKYEDWFNGLSDEERKVESDRNNSKSSRKTAAAKVSANAAAMPASNVLPPHTQQSVIQMRPNQFITLQAAPPQAASVILQQQPSIVIPEEDSVEELKREILAREPVEPVRSRKQLFLASWVPSGKSKKKQKGQDGLKEWRGMSKEDKRIWRKKLEPQRLKYIDDYTVFVRGLSKQELELYMDLKQKRDEDEETKKSEMPENSESSESSESEDDEEESSE